MREYDVTYIAKEYLVRKGWKIIAFNPPGSQGTFTIPNPEKDPNYRGQTGSLSPDIIAFKKHLEQNIIYIVESKPSFSKIDVLKMSQMLSNDARLKLLLRIIEGYSKANDIDFDPKLETIIRYANAYGGKYTPIHGIDTIVINQADEDWDPGNIDPSKDLYSKFNVEFYNGFLNTSK